MKQILSWLAVAAILTLCGCVSPRDRDATIRRLPSPWTTLKQSLPQDELVKEALPSGQASARP